MLPLHQKPGKGHITGREKAVKGGKQLKALSIHPYFAGMIFAGKKTVECRTWKTDYRGDILICSTAKRWKGTISGHALCIVRLADVVPFEKKHLEAACMQKNDFAPGLYAWILTDLRIIRPIPLKGKLSLWNYDGDVEILQEPETDEEDEKMFHEIWEPLIT